MLPAHPAVLRDLLEKYEAQELLQPQGGNEVKQRMDDLAYTLCIATGTRDIDAALIAARHQLPGARLGDDSILLHTHNQPSPSHG
ncbi:DUF5133 domain-containing protein [Streptomyces glebosus]|uniref:DUF5133 domain-containing protein n=1 Tax=Streptomyces glebosus TaxID=249580 RepID=A0A640SNQ4_9ACTN|nr:DUF5133 domain-containing protein [Streptomyces glebosus]GFE12718.1 DUF5133 domain-containing protein [Streptomyces glebosus]GHG74977.1 DUF5133 domain-containing protein [Streptomyces glebosus]